MGVGENFVVVEEDCYRRHMISTLVHKVGSGIPLLLHLLR